MFKLCNIRPSQQRKKSWYDFGITTFKPSQLALVACCFYLAASISHRNEIEEDLHYEEDSFMKVFQVKFLCRTILPVLLLYGLTLVQSPLSALIIIIVMSALIFIETRKIDILFFILIIPIILTVLYLFFDPWKLFRVFYFYETGHQFGDYGLSTPPQFLISVFQSVGFFGNGFGNGIQKNYYYGLGDDYVLVNIAEEFGIIGCMILLCLYAIIIVRIIKHLKNTDDLFGFYYTIGVMIVLGLLVLINLGVSMGLIPITRIGLPFVSANGSSILVLFIMMGPILSITKQTKIKTGLLERVFFKPSKWVR